MIKYFSDLDEEMILAIYSESDTHSSIAKQVGNNSGYEFFETDHKDWIDPSQTFSHDTIILSNNSLLEDIIELVNKKLYMYVIKI